jgi:hypothetical protein
VHRNYSRSQQRAFTDANREAWDEAAPVHGKINQARLLEAFARPGYNTLDAHCLDRLNEIGVRGKSIAHVCCNNGRELLSLKNLGAGHCVGFDASAAFIEQARELAMVSEHVERVFLAQRSRYGQIRVRSRGFMNSPGLSRRHQRLSAAFCRTCSSMYWR